MLGWKFSVTGSLLDNERARHSQECKRPRAHTSARRRPECGQEGGGHREKLGRRSFSVWDPCNPLKSHKTAKAFFGKAWRKQAEIWKSLEKRLGGRLYFAASARRGASSGAKPRLTR